MSLQYIAIVTGNNATAQHAIPILNGNAGDRLLNAIVLSGGALTPGTDVTSSFTFSGAVFNIPLLANINFSGSFLIQGGPVDLTGVTILALMQRA